jgi:hypothetical protein
MPFHSRRDLLAFWPIRAKRLDPGGRGASPFKTV